MSLTTALNQYREQADWSKLAGRRSIIQNKTITDWTVEQLNVQPYQHILEVGFGWGHTLQEVADKLKIGFLAGVEDSVRMYRRAFRRNKRLISRQLLQLHLGEPGDLSYPHHYFHTIYGVNAHLAMKDPSASFIQLSSMLRNGGRLVMVFQPACGNSEEEIFESAEQVRQEFIEAGLSRVVVEFRNMNPVPAISVTGFRDL